MQAFVSLVCALDTGMVHILCKVAMSEMQVLVVPILAGLSGRGVKPLTWASCIVALVGVGLLEQGGAPPGIGDVWNLLSALFFGLQVSHPLQCHSQPVGQHVSKPQQQVCGHCLGVCINVHDQYCSHPLSKQ